MGNTEKILVKLSTAILFGLTIFFIVGLILWFIPRDIADIEIKARKGSYKVGESIIVDNIFTIYGQANSRYTSRIVCKNGVERKYLIGVVETTSVKTNGPVKSVAEYKIPNFVLPEEKCFIQVKSDHVVTVLPFLEKTITDKFESNQFSIVE